MSEAWILVGELSSIPEQTIYSFSHQQRDFIIIRQGSELSAFVDQCSHQDVKLSEFGELQSGLLLCHAHGAVFDTQDGRPLCFPAKSALNRVPLKLEAGQVLLQIDAVLD